MTTESCVTVTVASQIAERLTAAEAAWAAVSRCTRPGAPTPVIGSTTSRAGSATTGRRLSSFAARLRWRALPGIFASALRG
ncbi:hypothetical protein LWC34_14810 [Kibdelosporangium philippinense]|uniref:Uncharacterized protein n=1 Tax=Kibdelosporangium philippinense TaxID=211113 RepID=A0ABS8Z892_9PSEU|nr:hypothetical protein [Kibdelosporangium philippinense]MCE7004094.1 hypothetical protein [Kibdelosporangium philippinense]